jgi:hypothetical protein
VAKSIFIADDDNVPASDGPYHNYYHSRFTKLTRGGRYDLSKTHRGQPNSEVTLDQVCNELVIYGSPNKVVDQLLAFRERVGDFGTLLYAGEDWKDRELGRRSMILLAEKVPPQINAAIGDGKAVA